jgi:hypothetical protein
MKPKYVAIPAVAAGVGAALAVRENRKERVPYTFKDGVVAITGGSRGLGLVLANSVVPGIFGRAMRLTARFLPGPTGPEGNLLRTGWESRSAITRSPLLALTQLAAEQNNELPVEEWTPPVPTTVRNWPTALG